MSDEFRISTQVLTDTARKIRDINDALDSKLAEINKSMNELEATFKSDSAT